MRQATYTVLGSKVDVTALSIAQRMQILSEGLNDRVGAFLLRVGGS